jgi:hypothetical protein
MASKVKKVRQLKKDLDKIYSLYIRTKYAKDGKVFCYTCGHQMEIEQAQCGHFNPRQHLATRWDERNTRPQCFACNMYYNGQPAIFAINLTKEYGQDILKEFDRSKWQITKLDANWYLDQIELYTAKLKELG